MNPPEYPRDSLGGPPLEDPHWLDGSSALRDQPSLSCGLRIRYRQPLQQGTLVVLEDGRHFMDFDMPQRGVAAGQFAAWHGDFEAVEVQRAASRRHLERRRQEEADLQRRSRTRERSKTPVQQY